MNADGAQDLELAHDGVYVRGVMAGDEPNGFDTRDLAVVATLPWTCGSMAAAARGAIQYRANTVSPTSGFHHAHYSYGGAFCTFNGLMMAARLLLREGLAERVGILDADRHDGDGTRDIIQTLGLSEHVVHYTFGGDLQAKRHIDPWLERLPGIVETMAGCQVILYQAGADPHVDDPLGGLMSSEQMRRRDRLVFESARRLAVPVAWNLAGGYQEPIERVLYLHDVTLQECLAATR